MIDIHSHLLPVVDDGSPSIEVSVGVLQRFRGDGVTTVVCTPHLNASEARVARHEVYAARFAELVRRAPEGLSLARGFEIMLDVPGADLTARDLLLGASTAVLVEFPRWGVPLGAADELRRLRGLGVVPVVAHPERYRGCTLDVVREWRRAGAVIQTDGMHLLGAGPWARLARELLQQALVDCIASDNHGDSRSLAAVKRWLDDLGAREAATILTTVNPARVLADQPPVPVPPVPVGREPLGWLRELLRPPRP